MEISLILLSLALVIILMLYFSPLVIYRIKRKKVIVRHLSVEGKEEKIILYLKEEDPLWRVIKMNKDGKNVSQS
ncbi:hypothetical protein [Vreelandella profundi]|uniref:hypothetical protein n=1 Tax=Vreelandella profundi TaxID=2852117 RepID=UPI001F1EB643|nr:hypothetical protein [Halomonas profundi]